MTDQGSEQAYNSCYDAFMAIPEEELSYCNMPLEVATAEASQLGIVAAEDRQALVDAGIDPLFVDTLSERAAAFTFAVAKYLLVVDADPEVSKLWKESAPSGYELQKYLTKNLCFAYRKDKGLTKSMAKIREGRGSKDMILDLLSLSILGTENPEPLRKMKMFDFSKLEEARQLHEKLSDLYARFTIDPKEVNRAKTILDRAYTYYKLAADEVKEHGQFVFEGTDRYESYISDYHQGLGKKSEKPKPGETQPEST